MATLSRPLLFVCLVATFLFFFVCGSRRLTAVVASESQFEFYQSTHLATNYTAFSGNQLHSSDIGGEHHIISTVVTASIFVSFPDQGVTLNLAVKQMLAYVRLSNLCFSLQQAIIETKNVSQL